MNEYESSEVVKDKKGTQYHIGLKPEDISDKILLVGDPERVERIKNKFSEIRCIKKNREFNSFTGKYKKIEITVLGTGIGCDNTEIAIIELCQLKFPITVIRCGTCGALQDDINISDLVISTGALRLENTSTFFVEPGYPAIANHEIIIALIKSAQENSYPFHCGITATTSSFYGGQSRHIPGFPLRDEELIIRLKKQGIKNFEMETSTLFTLATLRGFRAGSVCVVFASRQNNKFIKPDEKYVAEDKAIITGLNAFKNIHEIDKQKGKMQYWIP